MKFQMSQPIEPTPQFLEPPTGSPMSQLKIMAAPSPAKAHAHEMHEKAGSISYTCVRVLLRGDMKKSLHTKPGWGRTAPVCSVGLSGCTSSRLLPTIARR